MGNFILANDDLNGINGWLLLFVLQKLLSAFGNASSIAKTIGHPLFTTYAHHTIFLLDLISISMASLLGILAVIGIIRRAPWALNAVAMNLVLLVLSFGIGFLQPGAIHTDYVAKAISGLFFTFVWFAYFMDSERVRVTLGRNLFRRPPPTIELVPPPSFN